MKLIAVVGHGNGSGKTSLLESLTRAWPRRFAAVKFTTVFRDGKFCPKDAQRRCACSKLRGDVVVVSDEETLGRADTDTGRLMAAGADPVLWCLTREHAHDQGWVRVRELLPAGAEVLTEGNTALLHVRPEVMLFIANPAVPFGSWKSNWRELAERSDAVVVNDAPEALGGREAAGEEERDAAMAALYEAAPTTPRFVARLTEPFGAWAGPHLEELLRDPVSPV